MMLDSYEKAKNSLLSDKNIDQSNRKLFKEFFKVKEYQLKRRNNLSELDDGCIKTLKTYIFRFRNMNRWLKNKSWKQLTERDIKRFYDDMEDGKILNKDGYPIKDRASYYNKILKSLPFELAKKDTIAKKVLIYYSHNDKGQVRYFEKETFDKLVNVAITPHQKLLMWLAFDIGENVGALLKLQKSDCVRHINKDSGEPEYIINLRDETLKRSRTARSEPTNFIETTQFLDIILEGLKENDNLFNFGQRQANKFLDRCVSLTNAKVLPKGQKVTWKDFRSSMSCYLLKEGWTTDEINARLGHKASSKEIDKYVNYLAINKQRPKRKMYESEISTLREEVEKMKTREKMYQHRIDRQQNEIETFRFDKDRQTEKMDFLINMFYSNQQTFELFEKLMLSSISKQHALFKTKADKKEAKEIAEGLIKDIESFKKIRRKLKEGKRISKPEALKQDYSIMLDNIISKNNS